MQDICWLCMSVLWGAKEVASREGRLRDGVYSWVKQSALALYIIVPYIQEWCKKMKDLHHPVCNLSSRPFHPCVHAEETIREPIIVHRLSGTWKENESAETWYSFPSYWCRHTVKKEKKKKRETRGISSRIAPRYTQVGFTNQSHGSNLRKLQHFNY